MRERLAIQKAISFPERLAEKIQDEADRLDVSFSEIVRDCVLNDLPRLKERNRKRIVKRNQATNPRHA